MMPISPFQRFWWLPSAHAETAASVLNQRPCVRYDRQIINTKDNDEIALDYMAGNPDNPLIVIFHGLEGCSYSRIIRLLAAGFYAQGWTVAVPHFRSCGGHMNRLPRAYHAADIDDIAWMLNYCQANFPHSAMMAAGVSLGGTALLNYLAKTPNNPPVAAVTISSPFDLTGCVRVMDGWLYRWIYSRYFLKSLRRKIIKKSLHYPEICNLKALKKVKTIGAFDKLYTAPVHGFDSAESYWRSASITESKLMKVTMPLLCINALNDPLIPQNTLSQQSFNHTVFCRPKHGGHGGFWGSPENWLFNTTCQFLLSHA